MLLATLYGAGNLGDGSDSTFVLDPPADYGHGEPLLLMVEGALRPREIIGAISHAVIRVRLLVEEQTQSGTMVGVRLRWRLGTVGQLVVATFPTFELVERTTGPLRTDPDGAPWEAATVNGLIVGACVDWLSNAPDEGAILAVAETRVDVFGTHTGFETVRRDLRGRESENGEVPNAPGAATPIVTGAAGAGWITFV